MLTSSEVSDRNRQYKELSVSKNRQAEPFRLFVRKRGDDTYFCAMEGKPDYLCERGDEWKRLGIATHYYVSNIRQPF